MNKSTKKKGCSVFIVLIALVFLCGSISTNLSNRKYMERISGFDLPVFTKILTITSRDIGLRAFMKVGRSKATLLVAEYEFIECDHEPDRWDWGVLAPLGILIHSLPPKEQLKYVRGATETNSWVIYCHEQSGRFWIQILHPDMSGDLPAGVIPSSSEQPEEQGDSTNSPLEPH